jgi:electron transport complex protein RnfC
LRFLVDLCGGYTEDADRLIMGGPMMGFALGDDDVPVVKGTNCLLAATAETLPRPQPALPCIRCGACADACPASLLPQQLYWYARARDLERAREHNLFDCIECGACAYVCPSHIPLVDYYRFAKSEIWEEERERRKADLARERYEFRQQRLEREQREREERRQRKRAALRARDSAQTDKKAAIDAALARARRKQKNAPSDEQGSEGNEH